MKLAFERSSCRKYAVKIIKKKNFQSEGVSQSHLIGGEPSYSHLFGRA